MDSSRSSSSRGAINNRADQNQTEIDINTKNSNHDDEEYCYLSVSVAGAEPQTIVIHLHKTKVPKTCHNFSTICSSSSIAKKPQIMHHRSRGSNENARRTSATNPTYRNTEFHRIIPGFMVQGGDYENFDGTGGECCNGGTFPDESFVISHDREGVISMANRDAANTNGSQFFITLGKCLHLDGKHVAFGQVVDGMKVVRNMAAVETDEKKKPVAMQRILVVDCGVGKGISSNVSGEVDTDGQDKTRKDGRKSHKKSKHHKRERRKESSTKSDTSDDDDEYDNDKRKRSHKKDSRRRSRSTTARHDKRDHKSHKKKRRRESSSRKRRHDCYSSDTSNSGRSSSASRDKHKRRKTKSRDKY